MVQEEKDLLLAALCCYLPYGVKVQHQRQDYLDEVQTIEQITRKYGEIETESVLGFVDDFKPYLRPLSSMSEEERKYLQKLPFPYDFVDWLNAHHFDYRNLIEKGLALEAPKGMYD